MQGKDVFSPADADEICSILCDVRKADRTMQKLLRSRLRKEFYISDFNSNTGNKGFTEDGSIIW